MEKTGQKKGKKGQEKETTGTRVEDKGQKEGARVGEDM